LSMQHIKDLKYQVMFELISFVGRRILFNKKPTLYKSKNYLNLGCGPNIEAGYVNADFFNRYQLREKDPRKLEWPLDLRFPLVCDNNVFDGVYTEHTVEHLNLTEARSLFKELYRVMKQDAIIRITVPDLEKRVDYYIGKYDNIDVATFKEKYDTGCAAIRDTTQNYRHRSVWDFAELKMYLEEAGFKDIQKMRFGVSNDDNLKLDTKSRAWETVYVEGRKIEYADD